MQRIRCWLAAVYIQMISFSLYPDRILLQLQTSRRQFIIIRMLGAEFLFREDGKMNTCTWQ